MKTMHVAEMQGTSRLIYFGHHKCATQYIKAVVKGAAEWLGQTFETIDRPVEPAAASDGPFQYRLHLRQRGYVEPAADILYFANASAAAVAALVERGGYRGFHVIRDPRDVVISGYFSHLYSHPITEYNSERMGAWREQLAAAPSAEEGLLLELDFAAANFANLRGWDYANPHVFETRYESLIVAPLAVFSRAFRFWGWAVPWLGLTILAPLVVQRILRRQGGQPMPRRTCLPCLALQYILAKNAFARKTGGRAQGEENVRHHYRKGVAGDWRNHFTPRITAAFKERYGDLLVQLGYETDLDWTTS